MCDYSLHHVGSRPAKVNDRIMTTELARSSTRGFAAVGEHGAKLVIHDAPPKVAVCLLPGTELAFDENVRYDRACSFFGSARIDHKLARFRQIDLDDPHVHHDALEFPDGRILKVARLAPGQTARVLQLPVATPYPEHHHEAFEDGRHARPSESRVALNRVSIRSGMASVLMPNQGTVMLWRTCRSEAARLSITLAESVRRFKRRRHHTNLEAMELGDAGPVNATASFEGGAAVSMPKGNAGKRGSEEKTERKTIA